MSKVSKQEKEEARERLSKLLPEGSTVYVVLRSVSKSGMSRRIDLYSFEPVNTGKGATVVKYFLTTSVAMLLGYSFGHEAWCKGAGMRVDGGGMDMGFHVVNSLSYALHGLTADRTKRQEKAHRAGYTLRCEWI